MPEGLCQRTKEKQDRIMPFKFDMKLDFTPVERSLVGPLIKNTDQIIKAIIDDIGELFLKLVKFYAPRDTGRYAKSWHITGKTKNSVTIGTKLNTLYVVLEFGVDHEVRIDAKNAQALHWKDAGGNDHFAKFVIIPPRKPQPHVRRAIRDINRVWRHVALVNLGKFIPAFKGVTRNNEQELAKLEAKIKRPN